MPIRDAFFRRAIVRKLLINITPLVLFFPSMIWLIFELDWMENVVGGLSFVILVLGTAAVPAWWAARGIARAVGAVPGPFARGEEDRGREALSAAALTGVGLLALTLSGASRFNREHAGRATDVQVTVIRRDHKERGPRTPETWRLIVSVQGRREDVTVSAGEWERSAPGTQLSMHMLQGALGYPVLCSEILGGQCAVDRGPGSEVRTRISSSDVQQAARSR
jgi:hypothetical protein